MEWLRHGKGGDPRRNINLDSHSWGWEPCVESSGTVSPVQLRGCGQDEVVRVPCLAQAQCKRSPIITSQHLIPHTVGHPEGTLKCPKYHNAPWVESERPLENTVLPSLAVWPWASTFPSLSLRVSIGKWEPYSNVSRSQIEAST